MKKRDMKNFKPFILLFTFLFASFNTIAQTQSVEEYRQLIKQSLNNLSQSNKQKVWAYKRTNIQGKAAEQEIIIESFDPSLAKSSQWVLISNNGKTPSAKEQQAYQQQQVKNAEQMEKETEQGQQQQLADMINFDSLIIVKEHPQLTKLTFKPILENMGEQSHNHLAGTLIFDRTINQVTQLLIENTEPLNPAISVTLEQFRMAFELIYQQQSLLPKQISIDIYGKAAVFTTIDQKTQEIYSDYRYVGNKKPIN